MIPTSSCIMAYLCGRLVRDMQELIRITVRDRNTQAQTHLRHPKLSRPKATQGGEYVNRSVHSYVDEYKFTDNGRIFLVTWDRKNNKSKTRRRGIVG